MIQKSVENFTENDVKFKELVKDIVKEELKSYKEYNDKQIQIIFEKLQLYREDLRITYKLIQEIIELFGLHKENSELHRKKVDESLRKLQTDYNEYKKDISELFEDQMTIFDSIFESNNAEEQSAKEAKPKTFEKIKEFKKKLNLENIKEFEKKLNLENKKEAKPKTKAEMWEEQKAKQQRNLNRAERKVEIFYTKGSSDGK